ncbi:hypothetical protein [Paenibacillus sp. FSL R7-0333]|uniref:hypothetical protein n=1 Tax=Paenibacillus sp. FSL R7-0333 TaxID=1926587 RepID=UPI0030FBA970
MKWLLGTAPLGYYTGNYSDSNVVEKPTTLGVQKARWKNVRMIYFKSTVPTGIH